MAKSNTPEFGAGAATFNDVFGVTNNPRDVEKNPGGSAAAVASGQAKPKKAKAAAKPKKRKPAAKKTTPMRAAPKKR